MRFSSRKTFLPKTGLWISEGNQASAGPQVSPPAFEIPKSLTRATARHGKRASPRRATSAVADATERIAADESALAGNQRTLRWPAADKGDRRSPLLVASGSASFPILNLPPVTSPHQCHLHPPAQHARPTQ